MKTILISIFVSMLSLSAQADFVCQGDSDMGPLTVTVRGSTVTVVGANLAQPAVFTNVSNLWDGHETGLITAPGLSIRYSDDYGCIRNVDVTTNIRDSGAHFISTVSFGGCGGDSSRAPTTCPTHQ